MPKSKNYDNWIKQNYPRKCEICDHISNNPAAYSYHKKKHDIISNGTLCDHGCGNLAKYKGTGGKFTCTEVSQHCPEYLKKHSNRVKEQWIGNEKRKQETKKSLKERLHNPKTFEKIKKTKRIKSGLLTPEDLREYKNYARRIRKQAQRWAKEQGYILGQQTHHVDHKLSILDAWRANLPIEIVNHPANLQILEAKLNSGKGSKSIITVEELLVLTEFSN